MTDKAFRGAATEGRTAPPQSYEDHLPVRLRKAAEALDELVRLILGDAHGLGFSDIRILAYLAERPSASSGAITRDLQLDKAWVSRLLQVLAAKQLVVKERDRSDSRVVLASLTEKGRAAYEQTLCDVTQYYGAIVDGVDNAVATDLIARLETNLRAIIARLRSGEAGV